MTWDEQLVYALGRLALEQGKASLLELQTKLRTPLTANRLTRLGQVCMGMACAASQTVRPTC